MNMGTGIVRAGVLVALVGLWGCGAEARSEPAEAALPIEPMVAHTSSASDLEADLAQGLVVDVPEVEVEADVEASPPTVERAEPVVTRRAPTPTVDASPRNSEPVLTSTAVPGSRPMERPEPEPAAAVLPGIELAVALDTELNTKDHLPGDVFWATLLDDIVSESGLLLIPAGAGVRGVVTESLPSPDNGDPAVLEFEFDAILVDGRELPLESRVLYAPVETSERDSGKESTVKVVGGAAAGAILGRILGGDSKDAAKGAVVGAAAGAAVAAGTRDGHARIPEGAVVELEVTRRLRLVS